MSVNFTSPCIKKTSCKKIASAHQQIKIKNNNNYIPKKTDFNVSMKIHKQIAYDRDNIKQAEMPYFHIVVSQDRKNLFRLGQQEEYSI